MNFLDPTSIRLLITVAVLATVLALGVTIISHWRRKLNEDDATETDLLDHLRAAYDEGELDEEEYLRVRETIARRARTTDQERPGFPLAPRLPDGGRTADVIVPGVEPEPSSPRRVGEDQAG